MKKFVVVAVLAAFALTSCGGVSTPSDSHPSFEKQALSINGSVYTCTTYGIVYGVNEKSNTCSVSSVSPKKIYISGVSNATYFYIYASNWVTPVDTIYVPANGTATYYNYNGVINIGINIRAPFSIYQKYAVFSLM